MYTSGMSITVHALLFARYAELLGADRMTLALPDGAQAADAVAAVRQGRHGGLLPVTVLLAVNGRQAGAAQVLSDGDEVAILPPLAGG